MTGFDLSTVFGTVARAVPAQEVLVWRDRRLTYRVMDERADGLAHHLVGQGLGLHTERADLAGHESGQDMVGLYLRNGNEYLESMVAGYRARVAPFNVNYRYVTDELVYLLRDAGTTGLIFHAEFAPQVKAVREVLPDLRVLVQVADESGNELLPGAVDYESVLGTPAPAGGMPTPSGDDLFVIYTGGTTGMPKCVLWRQDDIYVTSMGGTPFGTNQPYTSYDEIAANAAAAGGGMTCLMIPPFMHGAAQWSTFHMITSGGKIVIPDDVHRFEAAGALTAAVREGVVSIPVVGDAVALPLVEEIERGHYDLSGLAAINNGSAPLTPGVRERILTALPHILVMDAAGSSETGLQMSSMSLKGMAADTATFAPVPTTCVVDEAMTRVLVAGEVGEDGGHGWLAQRGRVPLGYLGDAEKSARTYPVIDGERFSVPGDRARLRPDGQIELLGRDGITINTGGEKVFVEEVERALMLHPAVRDVVVVGRPSARWGKEVVAVVQLESDPSEPPDASGTSDSSESSESSESSGTTDEDLLAEASLHVARYKVPKAIVRVPRILRSPSGKADYRWAAEVATADPALPHR